MNAISPALAQEGPTENQQRRRRQQPEQDLNPGYEPRIAASEGARVEEETEQHDVHREKCADAEPDRQPGSLPLLTVAALYLIGDAAAIAAEGAALTVDRALHWAWANGQQAMIAQHIGRHGHAGNPRSQPCDACASKGRAPRPRVTRPSSRMTLPASQTPRRRHSRLRRWPTPPIISIAGKVPRPNAAIVRTPGSAPAVLAAWAAKA